jgi:hypothetical protein
MRCVGSEKLVATASDVRRCVGSVCWWQLRQMSGDAARAMVENLRSYDEEHH